ncbi:MAG TPA: SCO family protein [Candidatus Saccharimonadales bacterium]|jgi:cytochrome oxidase Cu insertion factor (SCO1/SenC/PrrC family)|nr:SCO family protein [Candidatus Saccharimonadales bacterium]
MTVKPVAVVTALAVGALAAAFPPQARPSRTGGTVRPAVHVLLPGQNHIAAAAGAGNAEAKNYTATQASYSPPDVTLIDRSGKPVQLAALLHQPRPVLLEFVFTSCTTICPILSATFSQGQKDVAQISPDYLMISISIDPEYDTPARLDAYARRYHPGENWLFLTGKKKDVFQVLKAFGALYQSDNKMYHRPYTFLRARSGPAWRRLEGHPSSNDLLDEYRGIISASGSAGK